MEAWFGTIAPRRHGSSSLARFHELSDDALVTSVVAESYLGCGRTTLYEMRKRGELETVRSGSRAIRYVVGSLRSARVALASKAAAPMTTPVPHKAKQIAEEVCA